ncbi:MAG: hypothetical protein OEY88_08905 [Candidatus Bathyarchaeota archaeon]|nr:hypothetical protein [Candidatus Bathyarchaeota archaeon]
MCVKTVSRDIKRAQRYHTGQFNKMIRQVRAERDAEYIKRYEGLPLAAQARQLKEDYKFYAKMFQTRQQLKETLTVSINMDEIINRIVNKQEFGRPFVTFYPKEMTLPLSRFRLRLLLKVGNQLFTNATLSVGKFVKT